MAFWVFSRRERGSECTYILFTPRKKMGSVWRWVQKRKHVGKGAVGRCRRMRYRVQAGRLGIGSCNPRARRPVRRLTVPPERSQRYRAVDPSTTSRIWGQA